MSSIGSRDRTYGSWACGPNAEMRFRLTVRRGAPVVDIRYGEGHGDRWQASPRGVSFELEQLADLERHLRSVIRDVKSFDLINSTNDALKTGRRLPGGEWRSKRFA